jgi:uncharacterized protein YqeY
MRAVSTEEIVSAEEMQQRLRAALRAAMKAKDTAAMSALRSVLAAIANAEAVSPVPPDGRLPQGDAHVAGSVAGVGAAETARRILTPGEVATIIAAETADRRAAAVGYEDSGNPDRAARLRREAEVIEAAQG